MSDRDILDRPSPPPGALIAYGPAAHQVIEVYGEASGARAWVFLIHGGFWRARWDRTHLRPLAAALAAQGYAVALVEYARTGMATGGWPGTFEDVRAALQKVQDLARDGSGPRRPVVLAGHSAGGQLAAWLLHQPEAAQVSGAISLAGCLDLALAAELGLDDGAAVELMGGLPTDYPERYAAADPALLGPTPYPLVVVHGAEDEQVPLALAHSWWEANASAGHDRLVVVPGLTHFPLIDPDGPFFPTFTDSLAGLLDPR